MRRIRSQLPLLVVVSHEQGTEHSIITNSQRGFPLAEGGTFKIYKQQKVCDLQGVYYDCKSYHCVSE
jgi:hypothetical protein